MLYNGNGQWTGGGDLNDPADWLIYDPSQNTYVQAPYPTTGAYFTGGGGLQATGFFAYVGLASGGYQITGYLSTNGLEIATEATAGLGLSAGTTVSAGYINVGAVASGDSPLTEP